MIAHAHRRIDQLQKQLAEQQLMEQQRTEKALERQKEEDDKLAEQMIAREKDRMAAELDIVKQKWVSNTAAQFNCCDIYHRAIAKNILQMKKLEREHYKINLQVLPNVILMIALLIILLQSVIIRGID